MQFCLSTILRIHGSSSILSTKTSNVADLLQVPWTVTVDDNKLVKHASKRVVRYDMEH